MGCERYITLENKEYKVAIDEIYREFQRLFSGYTFIKDETGFGLDGDHPTWPEVMQMTITTAENQEEIAPDGEKYIYCLFHLGGKEADPFIDCIESTLRKLKYNYIMDDL